MESPSFSTPPSYLPPSDASGGPSKVTPSGLWYVLAGVLAAVGIVVGMVLIVSSIVAYADRIDDFARVDVPGSATVQLDESGGYSVYYEQRRYLSDRFRNEAVDVEITAPDGSEVVLDEYGSDVSYTSGGRRGEGLYTFQADQPGAYEVVVNGEDGVIAVGRGIGRGMAGGIVGGIAIGFVGVVAGIVIAILVALKRGKNKRRLAPPMMPPPPPPGWGYPPPGGMPPQAPPGPVSG